MQIYEIILTFTLWCADFFMESGKKPPFSPKMWQKCKTLRYAEMKKWENERMKMRFRLSPFEFTWQKQCKSWKVLCVRYHWVYGWDTNTCMGEIPQQLWARRRGAAELFRAKLQWTTMFNMKQNWMKMFQVECFLCDSTQPRRGLFSHFSFFSMFSQS